MESVDLEPVVISTEGLAASPTWAEPSGRDEAERVANDRRTAR